MQQQSSFVGVLRGAAVLFAAVCIALTVTNLLQPCLNIWLFSIVTTVSMIWSVWYTPLIQKDEMDGLPGVAALVVALMTIAAWVRYDAYAHLGLRESLVSWVSIHATLNR